jgi:hypothetical protein
MLLRFESILFVLIITTLIQMKQARSIQKEDETKVENIESEREELNQLLNLLKIEIIKKLIENEDSKMVEIKRGLYEDYPIKKGFKKSWNLPIESLKWYSQNSAKSNAPQEMYDQLVGAFHNSK